MQWRMLQQEAPEDFVIATGVQHSVREFVTLAAQRLGIRLVVAGPWRRGDGRRPKRTPLWSLSIRRYFRPSEVDTLLGDASYAHERMGWKPTVSFEDLVKEMVDADLVAAERDQLVKKHGYGAYEYHE